MCKLVPLENGSLVADIKVKYIKNITDQAKQCKNIDYIMLFGSSLEERCTENSDIDIAVFGEKLESKYLVSGEFHRFHEQVYLYDLAQDYDILYFTKNKSYKNAIMTDIQNGVEIYRRAAV